MRSTKTSQYEVLLPDVSSFRFLDRRRTAIRLTRRQSQRPSLSRLVLSKESSKEEYGLVDVLLHEPRRRRSWLLWENDSQARSARCLLLVHNIKWIGCFYCFLSPTPKLPV